MVEAFHRYVELLFDWNDKMNLISKGDYDIVWDRHVLDSLVAVEDLNGIDLIDVGSGAGFPGIPIKLVRPELRLTIVESNGKRCNFLAEVVKDLRLADVMIVQDRAEAAAQKTMYREKFDSAVSRAVAHATTALELVLPFVRRGGMAYFWAGGGDWMDGARINNACSLLGGVPEKTMKYQDSPVRQIIEVRKVADTDLKYPRRVGMPEKKPL